MNWQAGTMLHPGAQRSEHRIKAPACRETQQAGTVTTSWQSGRQHGARPQHHLGISLRLAPTQHNHCIMSSQNNLKPLSEKWGEDQLIVKLNACPLTCVITLLNFPYTTDHLYTRWGFFHLG